MSLLLFLIGYIIPAIGLIIISIACIFNYKLAKSLDMFTYGKVIIGIIIGLVPFVNAMVFCLIVCSEIKAPKWWWFHRNVDTRKYRDL